MSIKKYYTQTLSLYSKSNTSGRDGVKEVLNLITTLKGRLDKATTVYGFLNNRETYEFTDILFTSPLSSLVEGTVLVWENKTYDVVSVIDPLYKIHHLEVLLKIRNE